MRRIVILAVIAALLLSGCSHPEPETPKPVQPFTFYYQTETTDFTSPQGLIAPEVRDLGRENLTDLELFRLYLQGPKQEGLILPFPKDTEILSVSRLGNVLLLRLNQAYNAQSGIYQSISDACLAKTGLELEGIRQVRIRVDSFTGRALREITLSQDNIQLYDMGQTTESTTVTLYFSDAGCRYLLSERRTLPYMEPEQLPAYVIELLLQGPQTEGMRALMPQGTSLLDINVDEQGLCAVDFTSDFFNNRPTGQREEQLTVLSIVNTLCELSTVSQVQFYMEGAPLDRYASLELNAPFIMDSTVIGPVREELSEFEGVLCLPDPDGALLHRFPIRVRPRGTLSREEALLLALFRRPSQNGLRNPLEGLADQAVVSVNSQTCRVELAENTLPETEAEREECLRCIITALTSLEQITSVEILEGGRDLTGGPRQADASWFLSVPD